MLIIDNETVDVPTATGPMRMLIVRPKAGEKYPAIIFYSEIFQVTGPIKRTAQVFAGHGFVVAVPEVYHELLPTGTVLQYTPEDTARGNACKTVKELSSYDSDMASAVAFMRTYEHCTGKVGVSGVCLGGGLAFRAALSSLHAPNPGPEVCVAWYPTDLHKACLSKTGDDSLERSKSGDIKCPLLLFFGRQDPHIPIEGRRMIHDALTAAGANFEFVEVNGQHAFLRDESSYGRYDPELALITYDWAVKAFTKALKL